MNKHIVELVAAIATGLAFGFALVEAWSYRGQSSYMPIAVTGFALTMALVWMAQSTRKLIAVGESEAYRPTASDLSRFVMLALAMPVYVLGVTYVGFFASTIVLVPALAFMAGYRNVVTTAIGTLLFVVVLYGVFRMLLSIPLPPDRLLDLLGVR